ncbi:MAG: hypothetical protein ACKOXB_00490 [Flavobacteriales bacterium]
MKKRLFYLCLLTFPVMLMFYSMSIQKSAEGKQWKVFSAHEWKVKDMVKNGKTVDIVKYTGDQYYSFFIEKEGKKKIKKFKVEMGGETRVFECGIVGDSLKLFNPPGWNNYKIISVQKEKAVLEQISLGTTVQWNLIPR